MWWCHPVVSAVDHAYQRPNQNIYEHKGATTPELKDFLTTSEWN